LLRVLGTVMFVLSLLWVESCGCNKVAIGWPPPNWAPNVGWIRLGNGSPLPGMVLLVGCESWSVVFFAVEYVLRRCLGVDCVRFVVTPWIVLLRMYCSLLVRVWYGYGCRSTVYLARGVED